MRTSTVLARWLAMAVIVLGVNQAAFAQRTVTLKLNTATLADTIDALDEIQIRGQLGSGTALPGGGVIDWNNNTTLKPTNAGGDYWDISFQIPDNDAIQYKFYAERAEQDGIGGWEDGDNHVINAGTGNVDRGLHYFVKGNGRAYDWSPFDSPDRPANTVGVHFRVFMCTVDGKGNGYDPNDATQIVGVRGAPEPGILDWGNTKVELKRESSEKGKPGFDIYSGVAYYPETSVGQTQMYKFVIHDGGNVGWENGNLPGDRGFVIPAADTTLHWNYFGNTAPRSCGLPPQLANVIFSVDLAPLQDVGLFNKSRGDTLQVRGGFNGWACNDPDRCLLLPFPGTSIFEASVRLEAFPESIYAYKFYIEFNDENFKAEFGGAAPPNGWEEPLTTTGADRTFVFDGNPAVEQFLGDQRFNDVMEGNIMLGGESTQVTFTVDMTPALSAAEPFNPATDAVYMDFTGDGTWAFLAGIPRTSNGVGFRIDDTFTLAPIGNNKYQGTFHLQGPTYAALQYKYSYGTPGSGTFNTEAGGTTAQVGRRRTRYVQPNPDGSWPATFSVLPETFKPTGTLPYDACNPGADANCFVNTAKEISGDVPSRITLSQNFPNPFNPSTSFEYTLDRATDVKLRIFDVLGREIATLVDGKQQANTYRVNFDASKFASGTYMYRLETDSQTISRTMVLLK